MEYTPIRKMKKSEYNYFAVFMTIAAAVVMAITIIVFFKPRLDALQTSGETVLFTVLFSILLIPVGLYFGLKRKTDLLTLGFILVMVAAAIAVRMAVLDHQSGDYDDFLKIWVDRLALVPGVRRWCDDLGDYNMPYIYFLTLVAKLPFSPLYLIKYFSILFDFLLAYFLMQCASIVIKSEKKLILIFIVVLFWPSTIINGAAWAQCDAIYTSLCIGGVYYGLTNRPYWCISLFALGLSFKLQAIFVLPILLVLLLKKKIKLKHLGAFPVVFLGVLVPALVVGKPFLDTISIYANQVGQYAYLTLNAPSMFIFTTMDCDYDLFAGMGIMMAGAAIVLLWYFAWIKREFIQDKDIMILAFLFAVVIPFFLPSMHERYFYPAEFFAFMPFFINHKKWYITFLMALVSVQACFIFILGTASIRLDRLAVIVIAIIGMTVYDFVKDIHEREKTQLSAISQ